MVSKGLFNVRGEGISHFIGIASSAPVFGSVKHGCNSHQQSGPKAPSGGESGVPQSWNGWHHCCPSLDPTSETLEILGERNSPTKIQGFRSNMDQPSTKTHGDSHSELFKTSLWPRSMSIHVSIHNVPNLFCHVGLVSRCLGRCIGVFRSV